MEAPIAQLQLQKRCMLKAVLLDSIEGITFVHDIGRLDSALIRQAVYTTTRLGVYFSMSDWLKYHVNHGKNLTTWQKVYSSLFAGGLGAVLGTPADLALIRMQSDSTLPPEQRRNYKHVFDAFSRIINEEGFLSCWKGASPTVFRAMSLNLGMLVSYDESKERLSHYFTHNPNLVWFLSSVISGGIAATMSLPFDNVKTKLQKQTKNPDGTLPYKNFLDCAMKTAAREGITGFWAGLPTYIFRIAPHVMIVRIKPLFIYLDFGSFRTS
jgi:solute carrier family 25 oxoglutarate transporter 11